MKYTYEVIPPPGKQGGVVAPESCRYDKKTEKSLMDSGYTIKLHGKRITKKEINSCSRN